MRATVLGTAGVILLAASTASAQQPPGQFPAKGAPLSQYGPQQAGNIAPAYFTGQQSGTSRAPAGGVQQAVYQQAVRPNSPQPTAEQSIYRPDHLQSNVVYPAAYTGRVARSGSVLQINPTTGRQELRPLGPLPPSTKPHADPYFMGRKSRGTFIAPVAVELPGQSVVNENPAEAAEVAVSPSKRTWKDDLIKFFWPWY